MTLAFRPRYANGHAFGKADAARTRLTFGHALRTLLYSTFASCLLPHASNT
ncbi:MAG: hypothetical protein F6K50_49785 [Moorea sp. SIO3I7]|uniref:hypothetical protein n=1 Tax=unclassified Moorena TaxID=2683338 RepID=UPI0013C568D6|nr:MULTISPECIES: hypothetical protein [unclassified Moorena]NEO03130.1 hypothetical protein [Moorena sp. SIO3I7]NEO17751.1 hypothetical protein [Moorena sp. SIO3E8]NEQ04303.1 hypothetical protein [Moorena sp. SIO3F7]